MLSIPELEPHCGSWIVTREGRPVIELFKRETVERIAKAAAPNVEIFTALQWLSKLTSDEQAARP